MSLLLSPEWLHGKKTRGGGGFVSRVYSEDEVRKGVKGLSSYREGMMSGESGLVWFTHLEMKSVPSAPPSTRQCRKYSAESQTTAPGEV